MWGYKMMEKNKEKRVWKIAAVLIISLFLLSSAAQAVIKVNLKNGDDEDPIFTTLDEDYYTWEDEFDNQQSIDKSRSENYDTIDGQVVIDETYSMWTDPSWAKMKIISLSASQPLAGYCLKLVVDYDTDMQSDYDDLRFKFQDNNIWLDYWIEERNPDSNDKYAIVWVKIPSIPQGDSELYMFYANPTANDESDYWALFDEEAWEKKDAHDHRVTTHMQTEGAWDPDVCYGNDRFLVTWEEGTAFNIFPPTIFQQQIRGCFYDYDGERSGNRFDITEEENPPYRYENPSCVYGKNGKYMVAFEHYNTPNDDFSRDIQGAIISKSGSGATVHRFDICTLGNNQADPCVAYDSDNERFFVVWEDARNGGMNYNIYGKLYGPTGNQIGGEITICSLPNSQCEPWVCFDEINNNYLVVWEEGDHPEDGPFSIYMSIFDENGAEVLSNPLVVAEGSSSKDYNFPCIASCKLTQRIIVTWQEDDISNGDWRGDIWGKIYESDGDLVVDTFKIANGEFTRTDVAPYLSSSFFVAFDGGGDIWGTMVSAEGEVVPYVIQLSDSDSSPADWVNIGANHEKIFVAWEDTRVVYTSPFDGMPDTYSNVWSLKIPSSNQASYDFGEEIDQVLEAYITSIEIEPENWELWHDFNAIETGSVTFDILDGVNPDNVLRSDVSPGANIENIGVSSIRLKASFSRDNPSSSPSLDRWSVSYIGKDDYPPRTTIDNIDGTKGLNDWYVGQDSVDIYLHAVDFPEDTGSGVDTIYYTENGGTPKVYNEMISLVVTQASHWAGQWDINFWSVDKKGNIEDKTKPENSLTIKIDADPPQLTISEPANEAFVEIPFWVRVDVTDNVGIDRVEFDIAPFGERDGLPYVDTTAPYEWYCDVDQVDNIVHGSSGDMHACSVSVMIAATAYDEGGQYCRKDSWVTITNWEESSNPSILWVLLNKLIELFPILAPILQPLIDMLG